MPQGWKLNPARDKDGLTAHQKEVADKVLELGKEAAAKEVWPNQIRPDKSADKVLKVPAVSSYMSRMLDAKGATRDLCAGNIADKIKSRNDKASLKATEMALEIHGELNRKNEGGAVPITKDLFVELCSVFWGTKPK